MPELLLGAGSNHDRKIGVPNSGPWQDLVTLDFNEHHKPDILWDLNNLPLPFEDNTFDSVSAFDVMEHIGKQGDWRFFFDQYSDIWRILKFGGVFCGVSPHPESPWCFGDPGHTRVISPQNLIFLNQIEYRQVGKTPMTDYRFWYKADFDLIHAGIHEDKQFSWILRAVKPSRIDAGLGKS